MIPGRLLRHQVHSMEDADSIPGKEESCLDKNNYEYLLFHYSFGSGSTASSPECFLGFKNKGPFCIIFSILSITVFIIVFF